MKIIIPVILIISILFLLSGCGEEEITVEQLKAFIGGTEGIKIEFTEIMFFQNFQALFL